MRLFSLIILLFSATQAFSSPWNLQVGKWQNFATYRYYTTTDYFDIAGNKQTKGGKFSKNELQYSSEYGLNANWNVGVNIFASSQVDRPNSIVGTPYELQGISRSDFFARYQLYRDDKYAIATQSSLSLPPYYYDKPQGGLAQFEKISLEQAVFAGTNFTLLNNNHWLQGKAAYRYRAGELDSQYLLSAQMGIRLQPDFAIIPEIALTKSANAIQQSFGTIAGDNNYDLTSAQLSLAYNLNEKTTLQLGAFSHLSGKNAGAGGGGICSLWFSL